MNLITDMLIAKLYCILHCLLDDWRKITDAHSKFSVLVVLFLCVEVLIVLASEIKFILMHRHDTPQVEIPNAHDNSVWDLAWHPIGYLLCRYVLLLFIVYYPFHY